MYARLFLVQMRRAIARSVQGAPLALLILLVVTTVASANIRITSDSASLTFGTLALTQTLDRTIRLSNTSTADVEIDNLSIGGANATDFILISPPASSLPIVVPAGTVSGISVIIRFSPQAIGTRRGILTIETSDGNLDIPMTGEGEGAKATISLSASSVDFGKLAPNDHRDSVLWIYSTGTGPARIQDLQVTNAGDFNFSATLLDATKTLPLDLAAGDSLGVVVRFDAILPVEMKSGSISVIGNVGANPSCTLSGEVDWASGDFNLATIDFGTLYVGEHRDTTLVYTNTSDVAMSLDDIELSTTEFSLQPMPAVPVLIEPGGTYTFHVRANPTTSGTPTAQLLTISRGTVPAFRMVNLMANVLDMPLSLDRPDTLRFTCLDRTSIPFTRKISNSGSQNFAITGLQIEESGITVTLPQPPVVVRGGADTTIGFSVDPATLGQAPFFVIDYLNGDNILLRDTITIESAKQVEQASLASTRTPTDISNYVVHSSITFANTAVSTVVVRLRSTDLNASEIDRSSIALVPTLSSATMSISDDGNGYTVTITSATPIVLASDGAILTFRTRDFISIDDTAHISSSIETPEWEGCLSFTEAASGVSLDSSCGSLALREYMNTGTFKITGVRMIDGRTLALDLNSPIAQDADISIANSSGAEWRLGYRAVARGRSEVLENIQALPVGPYWIMVRPRNAAPAAAKFVR